MVRLSLDSNPAPRTMGRLPGWDACGLSIRLRRLIVRPATISSALLSSPRAEAVAGAGYLIIDAADLRGPSNHGAA